MTNTNTEVLNSHQRLALTGSFPHMLLVKIPQSQRLNEHVSLQIKTFIFYDILASRQQCRCFLCILVLWMSKKISQQPSKCVCVFLCACMGQSVCLTLTAILCGTSWSSCWWMWNRGGYHISDIWLWSSAASWCSVKMRQSSLHAPDTRTHTHTHWPLAYLGSSDLTLWSTLPPCHKEWPWLTNHNLSSPQSSISFKLVVEYLYILKLAGSPLGSQSLLQILWLKWSAGCEMLKLPQNKTMSWMNEVCWRREKVKCCVILPWDYLFNALLLNK